MQPDGRATGPDRVVSTSQHSRLPAAPEGNPKQPKKVAPAGNKTRLCGV